MKFNLNDKETTFDLSVENLNSLAEQLLEERFNKRFDYSNKVEALPSDTYASIRCYSGRMKFNSKYKGTSIARITHNMGHELSHLISYNMKDMKHSDNERTFQGLCISVGSGPNYYEKQSYWVSKSWLYTDTWQIGQLTGESRTKVLKRIAKSIGIDNISWNDIRPGFNSIGQWGNDNYNKGKELRIAVAYELYYRKGYIKDWKHKFE